MALDVVTGKYASTPHSALHPPGLGQEMETEDVPGHLSVPDRGTVPGRKQPEVPRIGGRRLWLKPGFATQPCTSFLPCCFSGSLKDPSLHGPAECAWSRRLGSLLLLLNEPFQASDKGRTPWLQGGWAASRLPVGVGERQGCVTRCNHCQEVAAQGRPSTHGTQLDPSLADKAHVLGRPRCSGQGRQREAA